MGALVERRDRGRVGGLGLAAQPRAEHDLSVHVRGQPRDPRLERVEHAGHGLAQHRDPAVGVLRCLIEPVPDRLEDVVGQDAVHDAGLGDDEAVLRLDPVGIEHRVEVGDKLGAMARRDPRQDDAERGAAVPGVLQQFPDRGVRVAAGARHEQPQVRRVEELVREVIVRAHDGVDVGGVEQGDPLGHPLAGGEHQQPVTSRPGQPFLAHPGQRRQEHVLREPVDIVGMAGEDRRVGGWPPDPGQADLGADDAVDQRRLARPGRADQGDQERCGGLADTGQQVVVNLAEQLDALGGDLIGTRNVEDQWDGGDPLVQVEQGRFEKPGVDPDPRPLPLSFGYAPGGTGGRVLGG